MEAETLDDENPNVWVQYALYLLAINDAEGASEALSTALILDVDHVAAVIHMASLLLDPAYAKQARLDPIGTEEAVTREGIDMVAGMLDMFTKRTCGWNVPEAWYFLAKAAGLQGRIERQRECLAMAIKLDEGRPVRPLTTAFAPSL